MGEEILALAGDCSIVEEGPERTEHRGRVVTIVKPDNTVLVHDITGYQPVAWLTRADTVVTDERDGETWVDASKGDRTLRIRPRSLDATVECRGSRAGPRIGTCPGCGGALVRTDDVSCVDCPNRYGLPADATVLDQRCDCGLPRMHVERGRAFDLCLDRRCESLDDAVRDAFDRVWSCPACRRDLRIIRRGGLLAGCEGYPECTVAFAMPAGVIDGECACGLPTFSSSGESRCLDPSCDAWVPVSGEP